MIMKEIKFIILISLFLLMNILMISAANIHFIQSSDTGYQIQFVNNNVIKVNTSYTFNFHIFNSSNDYPLIDNNTRCEFHLYDPNGNHTASLKNIAKRIETGINNEWEIEINANNFSTFGQHVYIMQCNNTLRNIGGFVSEDIEVTTSGRELGIQDSILYLQYFFLLLILTITFFVLAFIFNLGPNKFVSIFFLSLGIMVIIINFGYVLNVINNYQEIFSFLNTIFNNMFYLLMILLTVGGIAVVVGLLAYVFQAFIKLRYGGK